MDWDDLCGLGLPAADLLVCHCWQWHCWHLSGVASSCFQRLLTDLHGTSTTSSLYLEVPSGLAPQIAASHAVLCGLRLAVSAADTWAGARSIC
jgi:hypothetical protein